MPSERDPATASDVAALHEMMVERFNCLDRELALREKYTDTLRELMNSRLVEMNNLRDENKEMQKTFLSRAEYSIANQRLVDRSDDLSRLVYIGLGVVLAVNILFNAFLVYFVKGH
jgi:hypothetical protein